VITVTRTFIDRSRTQVGKVRGSPRSREERLTVVTNNLHTTKKSSDSPKNLLKKLPFQQSKYDNLPSQVCREDMKPWLVLQPIWLGVLGLFLVNVHWPCGVVVKLLRLCIPVKGSKNRATGTPTIAGNKERSCLFVARSGGWGGTEFSLSK